VSLGSGKRRNNKKITASVSFFACKCWTSSDIWPKAKCLSFQRNDGIVRLGPPRKKGQGSCAGHEREKVV